MSRVAVREPVEGWTERQRQVLDLVVKGKSNPEIGEALGLSLDGVKWHMREILSKLNVESRTEAAEYWRRRNGMPSRFARALRGLGALPMGKAVAAAGVAAVFVATAMVAVVMAMNGGDDDPPAASETPPATATATSTPGASTTPPPPPSVPPAQPSVISVNGREVPLSQARVLPDAPPRNISLVLTHGCWGCDEPDKTIERIWWDDAGNETKEVLFDAEDRGGSYLTRIATNEYGNRIAVGLCVQAYCGPMGEYQDGSRVQLWESMDYGATWKLLDTLDGQAFPLGFTSEGLVVQRFLRQVEGFDHDLLNWHTGERFVYPDWDSGNRPQPLVNDTGVYWVYGDGKVVDEEFEPFAAELLGRPAAILPGPRAGVLVSPTRLAPGADPRLVLSTVGSGGKIVEALALPSDMFWRPSRVAGSNSVAGSMTWPGIGQLPTLVDPATGEVTRIRAPFEALAGQNDRNVVLAAQAGGNLARVNTPGSCLNLRDPQTSEILTCIGDGALMTVLGADNVTMLPVVFGPWSGWVSFEFVEVPAKAR